MVTSTGRRKGIRISESANVAASALARTTRRLPVILKDLGKPELRVLSVKEMQDIRVDTERYQRRRNIHEVNELIHVLRGGGIVPDPATLSRRPDGTLWVVDGQQRFWAHFETETPMRALIYDVPNVEAERLLFIVLNSATTINVHTKVHAWPGPVATLLRTIEEDKDSPYFSAINFGAHGARTFHAGPLMRSLFVVMTGLSPEAVPINNLLRRADVTWTGSADARDRARAFLTLAHSVFGRGVSNPGVAHGRSTAKAMPMIALAQVAYARWLGGKILQPTDRQIEALRRLNWDTIVPSNGIKFVPVVRAEIERRWKG